MYAGCYELEEISPIDTTKATTLQGYVNRCYKLKTLPLLNCGNIKLADICDYCSSLENIEGFTDLGKGFNAYNIGHLRLNNSPLLTHQSCLNIFNTIYSLNGTTGIIYLHNDVKANLSEEDIAIATNKGWAIQ